MRKYYFIILGILLISFGMIGAGCKKSDQGEAPSDTQESVPPPDEPKITFTTKPTQTTLEYFLQSYRGHVLQGQKIDKTKLKLLMVVKAKDTKDNKDFVVNLYTDRTWNDGKDHTFYLEEVKSGIAKPFGPFSSTITKLTSEVSKLEKGKVIGDFMAWQSIDIKK